MTPQRHVRVNDEIDDRFVARAEFLCAQDFG